MERQRVPARAAEHRRSCSASRQRNVRTPSRSTTANALSPTARRCPVSNQLARHLIERGLQRRAGRRHLAGPVRRDGDQPARRAAGRWRVRAAGPAVAGRPPRVGHHRRRRSSYFSATGTEVEAVQVDLADWGFGEYSAEPTDITIVGAVAGLRDLHVRVDRPPQGRDDPARGDQRTPAVAGRTRSSTSDTTTRRCSRRRCRSTSPSTRSSCRWSAAAAWSSCDPAASATRTTCCGRSTGTASRSSTWCRRCWTCC